jgi:hypothetical protein
MTFKFLFQNSSRALYKCTQIEMLQKWKNHHFAFSLMSVLICMLIVIFLFLEILPFYGCNDF